jgi:ketosteroid isomerase-like protein
MIHVIRAIGPVGLLMTCACLTVGAVVFRASEAPGATAPVSGAAGATGATGVSDEATLKQLNEQYVASFLKSDVQWYQQHLTEDFVCTESDGTVLDKASFLRDAAKGPGVADYQLVEVRVRVIGDTGLIHAQGKATRKDGTIINSRYTDVYVRVNGEWKAASAQITGIRSAKSSS